ncbi:MAG: redoxin domain-containing protein [Dehalococcoidia bacterium]|nr:redoxin domain-containing protein [Dehalococcoidia bacterium]
MDLRRAARYATVAAIVLTVGGIFVVRDVLPGDEADALGVASDAPRPDLGAEAPDFVLEMAGTGEHVRLSDFRGQTVVLNFWATWCVPCRTEMPDLQAAYEDDGVVVLAVNDKEPDGPVQRFVEEFALTFPVVLDRQGSVREHYRVIGLPATFFIDPDGIVRARNFGPVFGDILPQGIRAAGARR